MGSSLSVGPSRRSTAGFAARRRTRGVGRSGARVPRGERSVSPSVFASAKKSAARASRAMPTSPTPTRARMPPSSRAQSYEARLAWRRRPPTKTASSRNRIETLRPVRAAYTRTASTISSTRCTTARLSVACMVESFTRRKRPPTTSAAASRASRFRGRSPSFCAMTSRPAIEEREGGGGSSLPRSPAPDQLPIRSGGGGVTRPPRRAGGACRGAPRSPRPRGWPSHGGRGRSTSVAWRPR